MFNVFKETKNMQPVKRLDMSIIQSYIKEISTSEDRTEQTGIAESQGSVFTVSRSLSTIWEETQALPDVGYLLKCYVEALKTISAMPPTAQDFIAAQARKICLLELQIHKAGYKPVFHGYWWDLDIKVEN